MESLLRLILVISHINSLEVKENFNPTEAAFDLVLISTHIDNGAAYLIH